ncbi:MAG: abortive infection family protein [Pseudomonadota bacterium]
MASDLFNKVEALKAILISHSTGGESDDGRYRELRRELIATSRISKALPRMVHDFRNLSEFWDSIKPKFPKYAQRREFIRGEFAEVLNLLEHEQRAPSDSAVSTAVKTLSTSSVQDAWQKALERRDTDPEGAITSARTLLESVCKNILDATGVSYDEGADLPKLYTLAAKQLNLAPAQHSEQLFKQILGSCQAVVEGLGAIRNRYGDAHGKGKSGTKPAARHAALAVNLAGTMATFLLQTWEERNRAAGANRGSK